MDFLKKVFSLSHYCFLLLLISALLAGCASASTGTGFGERPDVQHFIHRIATKDDFNANKLTALFNQVQVRPVFVRSTKHPRETAMSWYRYRAIFMTQGRIDKGAAFWNAHEATFAKAQQEYGVPPQVILGILGVETDYGKYLGKYRVMDSLSTLAFNYPRREEFFQHELEEYLLLTRDLNIDPFDLYGSYAGAVGLPQFMPSSYRELAVSYSGVLGLRGSFGPTKHHQVDQDQHQYDNVEAYPVGDRSAVEHHLNASLRNRPQRDLRLLCYR